MNARYPRIGKDENTLLVVHEGLRLGEIGRPGTGLDGEPIRAVLTSLTHDAPRTSGDLGHHVGAEPLHDLVERALHGGERRQPLDHAVPPLHGFAALHGWPS